MGGSDIRRHGRYVWAALSVILLAGILVSLLIADSARRREETAAVTDAATTVEDDLRPLLSTADLSSPVTGARYTALLSDVQADVLGGPTEEVTIWKSDGTVLFSTDEDRVGSQADEARGALRRAVRSGAHGDVQGSVFRSWIPIRTKASGPVVAIAELDRPYAPIWTAANRPWRLAAIGLGTGLLATIALLLLSFRASRAGKPKVVRAAKPTQPPGDEWSAETSPGPPERKRSRAKPDGADPAYVHPGYREAVEAGHAAEERARAAEEQYRALQEQFKRALEELRAAEERAKQAGAGGPAGGQDPHAEEALARMETLQAQLREAEERASHAQDRAAAAEAALQRAHAQPDSPSEDEALRGEIERAQAAERESHERLAAQEARLAQLEAQLRDAGDRIQQMGSELEEAKEHAARAETARVAEERARVLEQQLREAEERTVAAEGRMREAEVLASQAAERAAQAEASATSADERVAEARLAAEDEIARLKAQMSQTQTEELQLAEARATDAEARLSSLQATLEEAKARVAELEGQVAERTPAEDGGRLEQELAKTHERLKSSSERLLAMEDRARTAERELEQLRTQAIGQDDRAAALDRALHGDGEPLLGEERRASAPFLEALTKDARAAVNSILGISLTTKHMRDPEELQPLLRQLTSQARKLDHLVADILEADRLARGTVPLNKRRTDLDALVRRVVEESGIQADRDVRIHGERMAVSVDPTRVEQIVSNLLANAASRTPGGSSVYVRVERTNEGAMIAVEDDQPSPDVPVSPIVTRFAELHGGHAEVTARLDGGSAFRVFLPSSGGDERESEATEAAESNGQAASGDGPPVDLADEDLTVRPDP